MSYPFRSILAPISFDDPALTALGMAKEIALTHSATLHLLHVVPMLQAFGEPDVEEGKHTPEEKKAEIELNEIAARHLAGVNTVIHTCLASDRGMAHAIIRIAGEIDADLIVMKTHGRKGLSHLLIGSVTEEVLRGSPCAVLTLTSAAQEKAAHCRLNPEAANK